MTRLATRGSLATAVGAVATLGVLYACSSSNTPGATQGNADGGGADSASFTSSSSGGGASSSSSGGAQEDSGSDAASGTLPDGAAPGDDAGHDAGPLPPGCVAITNTAPTIDSTVIVGSPPTPTGGALTAGTYYVEKVNEYLPALPDSGSAFSVQWVLVLTGGPTSFPYQLAQNVGGGNQYADGTITTSGTTITIADACNSSTSSSAYSTDDTGGVEEIRILNPLTADGGSALEFVLQKQ